MIRVNSAELAKAVGRILPAVSTKSVLPALECVLLEAKGGRLTLTASDLSMTIKVSLTCEGDGDALLPARTFLELLKSLPDAPVDIENLSDYKVSVTTDNGSYKLNGEKPGDFPAIKTPEADIVTIHGGMLSHVIRAVAFCASTDEDKGALCGVFIQSDGSVCATDAHRLSATTFGRNLGFDILIPRKSAEAVAKLFDGTGDIDMATDGKHAMFRGNDVTVLSRLIDQKFPDYKAIIPALDGKTVVAFDIQEMKSALRRAGLFANETSKQVAVHAKDGCLTLVADNIDFGRGCTERVVADIQGEGVSIGFNAGYLAEVLGNIPGLHAKMYLESPARAAVIIGDDTPESLSLVMPVMMNGN